METTVLPFGVAVVSLKLQKKNLVNLRPFLPFVVVLVCVSNVCLPFKAHKNTPMMEGNETNFFG